MENLEHQLPSRLPTDSLSLSFGGSFRDSEFTLSQKNCSNLFVREFAGKGEPLIFFHGWGLDSRSWLPAMKLLAGKHACLAFDLPGHGNSTEAFSKLDPLEIALDFLDTINRPGILVGHSMGARIAALASIARPNLVTGIVSVDGDLAPGDSSPSEKWRILRHFESEKGERVARTYFKSYCQPEIDPHLWGQLEDMLSRSSLSAKRETLSWILQQNCYKEPPVPSLAIFSDLPVSKACLKRFGEHAPNSNTKIVAGSDHFLPLTETEKIVETIERFYSRLNHGS